MTLCCVMGHTLRLANVISCAVYPLCMRCLIVSDCVLVA